MDSFKRSREQFDADGASDSDEDDAPRQKKPRFPKGKKQKSTAGEFKHEGGNGPIKSTDPRLAAKQRASRRRDIPEELLHSHDTSVLDDIGAAEQEYENDEDLEDDGIKIEPFNLRQERMEGYFDSEGNYVEYGNGNEIKDAWLDSVEVDTRFAERHLKQPNQERVDDDSLSSEEIGKIKRRIANALHTGETVLQALRRMKGTSNDKSKREKMSAETKVVFDQLTEDAMKLMDNGDYNVYDDKKKTFEREAEGYERLSRVNAGTSVSGSDLATNLNETIGKMEDIFADDGEGSRESFFPSAALDPKIENTSADSNRMIDIFGEDDAAPTVDMFSDNQASFPHPTVQESAPQPEHSIHNSTFSENSTGGASSDYVYDESSGYYYSSSIGYYFDPNSGLFCSATSGKWYKYNEDSNTYEEMDGSVVADH